MKNKDINVYRRRQFRVEKLLTLYKDTHFSYWLFLVCLVAIYICLDINKIFNVDLVYTIGIFVTIFVVELCSAFLTIVSWAILLGLKKYYFNKVRFLFNEELKENNKRIVRICDKD